MNTIIFTSRREAQNAVTKATAAYEKAQERRHQVEIHLALDPGTFLNAEQAVQATALAEKINACEEFTEEHEAAEAAYYEFVDGIRAGIIGAAQAEETAAMNHMTFLFNTALNAGFQVHCRYHG